MQALNKEYATRYLEHLGIAPAKATLDLVQRNVPLTEQCITTTLRVRTHSMTQSRQAHLVLSHEG